MDNISKFDTASRFLQEHAKAFYDDSISKSGAVNGGIYLPIFVSIRNLEDDDALNFIRGVDTICNEIVEKTKKVTGLDITFIKSVAGFNEEINMPAYYVTTRNFTHNASGNAISEHERLGTIGQFLAGAMSTDDLLNSIHHTSIIGVLHNSPAAIKKSGNLFQEMNTIKFLIAADVFSCAISPNLMREMGPFTAAEEHKFKTLFAEIICGENESLQALLNFQNKVPYIDEVMKSFNSMTIEDRITLIKNKKSTIIQNINSHADILEKVIVEKRTQADNIKNWLGCIKFMDIEKYYSN